MPRKSSLNKSIKVEKPAEPVAQDEEIFEVEAILEKRILAGKVRRKKKRMKVRDLKCESGEAQSKQSKPV